MAVLLPALFAVSQQEPTEPAPYLLSDPSIIQIHLPRFSAFGPIRCDTSGSTYYELESETPDKTILRISANGQNSTVYSLPTETPEGGRNYFQGFSVTPSGLVRIIFLKERTDSLYVRSFGKDGSLKDETRLSSVDHIRVKYFVSFEDGSVWLNAYYGEQAPEQMRGRRYSAIFDPSGKLVKELDSFMPNVDLHDTRAKTLEGDVALGQDGNLYLLTATQVIVISQSGEVVRKIKFTKTSTDQIAEEVKVSNGLVAITLSTVENIRPNSRYLVMDSMTGQVFGAYELSNTNKMMLCFDREEGFTFRGGDKTTSWFERYAVR